MEGRERSYEFGGSRVRVRTYTDVKGYDGPLFVVEEGHSQVPLSENREGLANALAEEYKTTLDKMTYWEQSQDGSLRSYDFGAERGQYEVAWYRDRMPRSEWEQAERDGFLKPEMHELPFPDERNVSQYEKQAFEKQLGAPLESYEQQQNRDWSQFSFNRDQEQERSR